MARREAGAVMWVGEGVKAGIWRGVIDDVEDKSGAFGSYTSGTRVWRCFHKHRSETAALTCAQRELLWPAEG